jgi:hypothetical protein
LCVKIIEANVFENFRDGGEALVWIEVFWGGVMKKTRIFKRENVQQTLYFKISIPPDIKKNQTKLEEYLQEYLTTKSEFQIQVWVDTYKSTIDSIGSGKMCLQNIASHSVQYEDQEFIDPITKSKEVYQARVYKGNIRLTSQFWANSNNIVHTSCWFQEDLPYPGVDLSKLKPKTKDSYPQDIEEYLMINERQNKVNSLLVCMYTQKYEQVLDVNWETDYRE